VKLLLTSGGVVALMVAPRAGRSGRAVTAVRETLTVQERRARLRRNVAAFVERVLEQ
jgi:hypothetical protein